MNGISSAKRLQLAQLLASRTAGQRAAQPLSRGQQALWFLHQEAPESPAYTILSALRIRSPLDMDALRRALQTVVKRHPQLRATFHMREGMLSQAVGDKDEIDVGTEDLNGRTEAEIASRVRAAAREPFDLEHGPLFRARLFRCGANDSILLLTVHHIIFDGWSLWLVLDELKQLYSAFAAGLTMALPPAGASYLDHVRRQDALVEGARGEEALAFWTDTLADVTETLALPLDRARPPVRRQQGDECRFVISAQHGRRLRRLARDIGVTSFSVLLAAYHVLLSRYSGQKTVPVGTHSSGRRDAKVADVVGYFVNPVVVVGRLEADPSFAEFASTIQGQLLEVLDHDELPFPCIVERMRLKRNPSTTPLFQASFVLQKAQRPGSLMDLLAAQDGIPVRWGNLDVEYYDIPQQAGQFDLAVELYEVGEEIRGAFKYDTALFDAGTISRLAANYGTLIGSILHDPESPVSALDVMSEAEIAQVQGFATRCEIPAEQATESVVRTFTRQVREQPSAIAVTFGSENLTYRELDLRSNRLAHRLLAQGVGKGDLVGLSVERSPDIVIGILGILKAGAAYVPLDPALPDERVSYILEDSGAKLVVTQDRLRKKFAETGADIVLIDAPDAGIASDDPDIDIALGDPIYVIYTSGTTGRPKGVQLNHGNVARLFTNTRQWFGFGRNDVWTLFHSFAFDFSVWEMWGALIYGGRLVVVPYSVSRSPADFVGLVRDEKVTVLNQSPSAFRLFAPEEEKLPRPASEHLRFIIFGGEALDLPSLRPWFRRHGEDNPQIINMYGITETTVHVTYRRILARDAERPCSVIGVPIPDLRIRLLDSSLKPVPIGVAGEIFVDGAGVADGYLHRPELTQARFVNLGGDRLYRSGDLARYLSDGDIEYLGRADKQVKIRGFRIELGEIEAQLCQHPDVSAAIVTPTDLGTLGRSLVAYVRPHEGGTVQVSQLRHWLAGSMPDYMVPTAFVPIDSIPLTGNGKLDYSALPKVEMERGSERALVRPRNAEERRLAAIWQECLGVSSIGVRDDFFELGGHSLIAVHAVAEINRIFDRTFPTSVLFSNPTIEALAELLRSEAPQADWSPIVPLRPQGAGRPFFCVAGGGGSVLYFQRLARETRADRPFHGVQLRGVDGRLAPHASVEDVARESIAALLNVQPAGPYRLGGHCYGGLVAFEMARQLVEAGKEVEHLVIMDAPAPRERVALNNVHAVAVDQAAWIGKIVEVLAESAGHDLRVSPDDIRRHDDGFAYAGERLSSIGVAPAHGSRDFVKGFYEVFVANSRTRYTPDIRLDIDITLIRAGDHHPDYDYVTADEPDRRPALSTLGWHMFSTRPVRVVEVPGTHLSMLNETGVRRIAEEIDRLLG